MKRRAFTLIEVMAMAAIISMVSTVAYRLMTGTFSQFFKSQTKLTNLRAASLILERLKADIRLAVIPQSEEETPVIEGERLIFYFNDEGERRKVTYLFKENGVERSVEGGKTRWINMTKVRDFKVEELKEDSNRLITIKIVVDSDLEQEKRTQNDKGNKVELRAVLYPRFFPEMLSQEERYWNRARQATGGTT
ncbi:MAG TPA: prepilin-type N-terminal cleavage/methylation domain-containing protein [Candidatus Rifleibacterium sp.]|nr:prepilin-type N-terminal cleavage/methylation domain-containing protein [Candidatus Rifleibacterium sp.]HPT44796.1 prepilin-type N-terminal cleavage/methylation domain-containing protein [Candidatus Rifleibacterium sp.]